jgi:histidyl-tRNA synthetase
MNWSHVRKELIEERQLSAEVTDRIGEYVKLKGDCDLIERVKQDAQLMQNKNVQAAVEDLQLLFKYLSIFDLNKKVSSEISFFLLLNKSLIIVRIKSRAQF